MTISDQSAQIAAIAIQNDYIVATSAGCAYVFVKPSGGWASEQEGAALTPSDPEPNNDFGVSAAAWGNTVVVGAPGYATETGKAYVYVEPSGGWVDATEDAHLTASDGAPYWQLGTSVAITGPAGGGGNLIAVGAPQNYGTHTVRGGAVYVYDEPPGGWSSVMQTAELSPREDRGAGFGSNVTIAPEIVVGGAPSYDVVWIFDEPSGGWTDSAQPSFALTQPNQLDIGDRASLTQNGEVLTVCCGRTSGKSEPLDLGFVWHADQDWSTAIRLSAEGLTSSAGWCTSTHDWAFLADEYGNIFVFDGK
ncbi:MAG TPA: hypothetical protein VF753_15080 [Terriglobales bacterium]